MFLEFTHIEIENFMNYKDKKSISFEKGIDLIYGENGVGKSTWSDAIFYALFGKPFRKIKVTSLINWEINKKMLVTLDFNIGKDRYRVIRGQKPSKFSIYKNSELIPLVANNKDYQANFERIIKMDELIFRQLVILGSNLPNSKSFMELNNKEKEMVFSTLTDTSIFADIKEELKNKIKPLREELKTIEDFLKSSQEILDEMMLNHENKLLLVQQNLEIIERNKLQRNNLNKRIIELENKIKILQDDLIDLESTKDELHTRFKSDAIESEELEAHYKKIEKEIHRLSEIFNERNQKIDISISTEKDKIKKIQQNKKNLINELSEINYSINTDKNTYRELSFNIENLKKTIEEYYKKDNIIKCSNCNEINYILKNVDIEKTKEDVNNLEQKIMLIKTNIIKKYDLSNIIEQKITLANEEIDEINLVIEKHYKIKLEVNPKMFKDESHSAMSLQNEINIKRAKIVANNKKYHDVIEKIKSIRNNLLNNEENLKYHIKQLSDIKDVKKISIDTSKTSSLLEREAMIKKTKRKKSKIEKEIFTLTDMSDIVSGDLKDGIIRTQIPLFNKEVNYFLNLFSTSSSFILDEHFKDRIISSTLEEAEFNSLSNGQKSRVTFSIMFGFLKLIESRNSIRTNTLILDEVLDTSIDSDGKDELLNILSTEFKSKNIIIISHSEEIKQRSELFNRIIKMEKK